MTGQPEERKRYDQMAAHDGDAALSHYTKTGPRFRLRRVVREAIRLMPARVLDLGCGDGVVLEHLRRARPGAAATGLDWAGVALRRARQRGLDAVQADATQLPLKPGRFDLVIATEVLEHVADPGAVLCEARRMLRPGGCLLLTVPAADWHKALVGLYAPGRVRFLDPSHRREWAIRQFGAFSPVGELYTLIGSAGFTVERRRGVCYGVWRLERMLDRWLVPASPLDKLLQWIDRAIGALPVMAVAGKYLLITARRRERE